MKTNAGKRSLSRMARQEARAGYLFILPTYLFYFIFMLIPLGMTIYYSFTKFNMVKPPQWIGLSNYIKMFSDKVIFVTLKNTVVFTVTSTVLKMMAGFILAVLFATNGIYRPVRSIGRGVLFFPYVVGLSYIALAFGYLFATDTGAINWFLVNKLGMEKIPWFTNSTYAMLMLILIDVWKNMGFAMLLYLAGMQSISSDYYEAASLDGATRWQQTIHITLPLVLPTTVMCFILFTINGLQLFDAPSIITNGGPGNATRSLVMYIYMRAFTKYEMGYASAISLAFMLIMAVVSYFQLKLENMGDAKGKEV